MIVCIWQLTISDYYSVVKYSGIFNFVYIKAKSLSEKLNPKSNI